jgi:hypothetical protein
MHDTKMPDLEASALVQADDLNPEHDNRAEVKNLLGELGLTSLEHDPIEEAACAECYDPIRSNDSVLKLGSKGLAVEFLQQDLNRLRGANEQLEVSGTYDAATKAAVEEFQSQTQILKENGEVVQLVSDGIVGARTMRALDKHFNRDTLAENDFAMAINYDWHQNGRGASPAQRMQGARQALDEFRDVCSSNPEMLTDQALSDCWSEEFRYLEPEFLRKVEEVSWRLGTDPDNLMALMSFESARTFDPAIRNKHSGATGLIQFMRRTAEGLGTSLEELAEMSRTEQMDYVEMYLMPYAGRVGTFDDLCMAVFCPRAVGKSDNYVLYNSGLAYSQNAGVDGSSDGVITKSEYVDKALGHFLA